MIAASERERERALPEQPLMAAATMQLLHTRFTALTLPDKDQCVEYIHVQLTPHYIVRVTLKVTLYICILIRMPVHLLYVVRQPSSTTWQQLSVVSTVPM